MKGKAMRKTYQKLLAYERAIPGNAWGHVSDRGISMGQATPTAGDGWRDAEAGVKTKIRKRTVASLSIATESGKSAKVIASTTTLSAGEANMVASTDSALTPDANRPRAMGATQFVQTASGTPAAAPKSVFSHRELVRRRRNVARKVSAAGPNRNEKVMPMRLASSQLIVVRHTRTRRGMLRCTEYTVPNVSAPAALTLVPA